MEEDKEELLGVNEQCSSNAPENLMDNVHSQVEEQLQMPLEEVSNKNLDSTSFQNNDLMNFNDVICCEDLQGSNVSQASGNCKIESAPQANEEVDQLNKEIASLKIELGNAKVYKMDELRNLRTVIVDLKKDKKQLTADIERYKDDVGGWLQFVCRSTQSATASLGTVYQRDFQEKRELLSEMTSMNEELNRRGETISSLKEVVSMYEKKVIELNNQQDCSVATNKQLREELTEKTQRAHDLANLQEISSNVIIQLREELDNTSQRLQDLDSQQNVSNDTINQLRDELAETKGRCCDLETELSRFKDHTEADRLSTSTVSRVDEANRLRDVEDSFEDRYCKLKVVAAKLKKRATETQQQLSTEQHKWATERNSFITKLNQLNSSARNNQTLQQECDRLADELEAERRECRKLQKVAADSKVVEVTLKASVEELQTNLDALKVSLDCVIKEKDSIVQTVASKKAELEAVTKEKVAEQLIREEKAREVAALELRLREEQDKLAALQREVDSAKMEARKQGVLSLEIQNYEKSLEDISNQLKVERGRVASLEAEVQTLQDIRDSLQEQIRLLEDRVQTEELRCQQSHDQLSEARTALHQAEGRVEELESRVAELIARLEQERASAEAASLELASLSSAVQTNTDLMLKEKSSLSQQVTSLNSHLATVTATLEQTENELASVRADFDKYKVRAASVLRKHQSAAVSQAEAEANHRADELQALVDNLRIKLDAAISEGEEQARVLAVERREREAAETRCVALNVSLTEKSQQLERAAAEHRSQKISLDTLVNCYKSQLEEKERALQERTEALTEQLEALKDRLKEHNEPSLPTVAPKPEPPLLEREDGEGSEYIPDYSPSSSPPRVSPKPLLPLDKLLESNDNIYGGERELSVVKAELEQCQKRAQHQALLLADTEQDAARKEQLITVLKKEIGRLERCIQRQPHAQNTEYLKNIVFKFVTLETGEDRLRLVPVITTLLQLSPEETQRLTVIANGQSTDPGVGWGSYFSAWR